MSAAVQYSAMQAQPAERTPDRRAARTLVDCFLDWEQRQPDTIYFTQPVEHGEVMDYSWREVGDQARRMAGHLRSLNLPPHSQIALLGKNSAHWIMADLAIWLAGHVSVPLYPTLNADTARYVLEHSEAKLLFVGKMDELWPIVQPGVPVELPLIMLPLGPQVDAPRWQDIVARTAPLAEPASRTASELATIIYTSGSTGKPKGVMISFGAMLAMARGFELMFPVSNTDRMLSYLPLAHAAERAMVETLSLYFGLHVYFAHSLDTFMQDLQRARPTLFFSVPRLWTRFYLGICEKLPPWQQEILLRVPLVSRLIKRKILTQLGLQHVRAAVTGSAPLAPSLIEWYRRLGLELLEGYAMSENFAYSHGNLPGQCRVGYVGHANPGVECAIGDNGEVLVKSPATMLGYFKRPDLTFESFTTDGFLKTGDRGEIDDQGRLKITGRVKELFKTSKGKYVAPVPIENKLNDHPLVEAVCVTGPSQPQPFALVMLSAEAQSGLARGELRREQLAQGLGALLERVNATLEEHERLDYLAVVKDQWAMANGFLTPTMKIRREMIEQRYLPSAELWLRAGAPVVWESA